MLYSGSFEIDSLGESLKLNTLKLLVLCSVLHGLRVLLMTNLSAFFLINVGTFWVLWRLF